MLYATDHHAVEVVLVIFGALFLFFKGALPEIEWTLGVYEDLIREGKPPAS